MSCFRNASPEQLVQMRDLVLLDPTALRCWSLVLDDIITTPSDTLRLKALLAQHNHAEAVLESLQILRAYGEGDETADLLQVLRKHNLYDLADKIEEECFGRPTKKGTWIEVPEVMLTFTGRMRDLDSIHDKLSVLHCTESASANVVCIYGPDGTGKLSLARKYAYDQRSFYDGNVLWIDGGSLEAMRASFLRIAAHPEVKVPGLMEAVSNAKLAASVYRRFQMEKSLFVFHNVNFRAEFNQFRPQIKNPKYCTPYVLITTSSKGLMSTTPPENQLTLGELSMEDAVQLVRRQLPECNAAGVKGLAQEFKSPLVLQLSLAYIKDKYPGDPEAGTKYIQEFFRSKDRPKESQHRDLTALRFCWGIERRRIMDVFDGDSETPLKVIKLLSVLDPDDELEINMETVKAVLPDEQVEPSVDILDRFSLIRVQGEKVTIHRLVQRAIKLGLSADEGLGLWRTLLPALLDYLPLATWGKLDEQFLQTVHARNVELFGKENWASVFTNYCLGYIAFRKNQTTDALNSFAEVHAWYASIFGPGHQRTMAVEKYVNELKTTMLADEKKTTCCGFKTIKFF